MTKMMTKNKKHKTTNKTWPFPAAWLQVTGVCEKNNKTQNCSVKNLRTTLLEYEVSPTDSAGVRHKTELKHKTKAE